MNRERLFIVIALITLVILGYGLFSGGQEAPVPEQPKVTIAPKKAKPAPTPRKLRFQRSDAPAPEPTPRTRTSTPLEAPPERPTDAPIRSLDDLGEHREPFIRGALGNLSEVMKACEDTLDDEPIKLRADARMDDRGLVSLELEPYETDEDGLATPSNVDVPEAFRDCIEDVLWEQEWMELPEGAEVPFMLTFDANNDEPED